MCVRCGKEETNGYPNLYCRECVEIVAWIFKNAREIHKKQ